MAFSAGAGSSGASGISQGSNASTAISIAGISALRIGEVIASTYSASGGRPDSLALSA
jgi:hypothetical protein